MIFCTLESSATARRFRLLSISRSSRSEVFFFSFFFFAATE